MPAWFEHLESPATDLRSAPRLSPFRTSPVTDPVSSRLARPATLSGAEAASDRGALAREQLIKQATRIFAAKGFAGASTREICEAAGANVAAIHYYFGDKEGLYRAVLLHPISRMTGQFGRFDDASIPFEQVIRRVLGTFVDMSLKDDAHELDVTRLHLRESLEPSAIFRDVVAQSILPQHNALAALIAAHCGLKKPDTDIHQLTFAMFAMASDYCMSREFINMLAPQLLTQPRARERIVERLVGYSMALLGHEKKRRAAAKRKH